MIFDKVANKFIPKLVSSNRIDQPLTKNATIYKQHRREEYVPETEAIG